VNGKASSDRFSFSASQSQGGSYTLNWQNNASPTTKEKTSVYLELIYPATGEIFTPLEAK
jgi:hypothetical protein